MREKVSRDIRDQLESRAQEFNIFIEGEPLLLTYSALLHTLLLSITTAWHLQIESNLVVPSLIVQMCPSPTWRSARSIRKLSNASRWLNKRQNNINSLSRKLSRSERSVSSLFCARLSATKTIRYSCLAQPDLELSFMVFLMSTLTCRLPLSELRASPSRRNWFPTPQKSMVQPWSKFGGSRWLFASFCPDVSAELSPHNHRPRRISLPRWLVQETLRICHLATTCS